MTNSLENRIRRLEAHEEIRSLVARYTYTVDNRDLKAIVNCFSEKARFRSQDGVLNATGRNAIIEQFRRRFSVLEHFRAKWEPVRVKKMRPNNTLERFLDSYKLGTALGPGTHYTHDHVVWLDDDDPFCAKGIAVIACGAYPPWPANDHVIAL